MEDAIREGDRWNRRGGNVYKRGRRTTQQGAWIIMEPRIMSFLLGHCFAPSNFAVSRCCVRARPRVILTSGEKGKLPAVRYTTGETGWRNPAGWRATRQAYIANE